MCPNFSREGWVAGYLGQCPKFDRIFFFDGFPNESFEIVTALNNISEDHNVMKQELFILRQKQTISQTATTPPTEAPTASTPIVDTAKQTPPISPPATVLEDDDRIDNILMVGDSISISI
jgi:hypothetical protein